jgi:hypothetical protein
MHQSQIFFNQDCLVCGRKMRVRVELLGKEVACGHCNAVTVAGDDMDINAMLTTASESKTSERWDSALC